MEKKTNLEMLIWGLNHIAENHKVSACTDIEDGDVCVYGKCTVPLLADVQMLSADIGIDYKYVYPSEYGVDIDIPYGWAEGKGKEEYAGLSFWKSNP